MFQKLILIFILFVMNQSVGAHLSPEYSRKKIGSNKALKIATSEIKRLVKEQRIGTSKTLPIIFTESEEQEEQALKAAQ